MRICQIGIRGFRGIRNGLINFSSHTALLGANNAGKSTIAEALALLFARERMVRPISDWDFFGGFPKPDSRFYIIATVTDFGETDDPTHYPDWFIGQSVATPIWWIEESATVAFDTEQPDGSKLAAQIAIAGRYEEETCEYETVRYFYHGESDPFTDGCESIPPRLLREVGVFLLSSNRDWDKLLSFGSSTLLKVVREYEALPGAAIETLKNQLRTEVIKIEESSPLSEILDAASKELQSFLLLDKTSRLAYRPTSLDALSVLQSLVAHIKKDDDTLLPVARQGAGMISLQAFLLLLAFAEQRRRLGRNFILVAEEPELHLHPSLHHRLVNRIRAASAQSIVTTQSPIVAAGYQPSEVIFVRNSLGDMTATRLRTGPVKQITTNSVRKLYLAHRSAFYEALMGGVIVVPEGIYDFEWLSLWQRLAQSSQDQISVYNLRPITIVPTQDSLVETYEEIVRFRPDAIPLIDGDEAGEMYLTTIRGRTPTPPRKIIRYGPGAAVECLAAWILEPALAAPGDALEGLQSKTGCKSLKELQGALFGEKKEREFRENVVWESIANTECCRRACEFFHDIAAIAFDESPLNSQWSTTIHPENVTVFTAGHIGRV